MHNTTHNTRHATGAPARTGEPAVKNLRAGGHDGEVYYFASPDGGRTYLEVTGPAGEIDVPYLRKMIAGRVRRGIHYGTVTWTERGIRNLGIIDLVQEMEVAS